jgi:hypothetical protein
MQGEEAGMGVTRAEQLHGKDFYNSLLMPEPVPDVLIRHTLDSHPVSFRSASAHAPPDASRSLCSPRIFSSPHNSGRYDIIPPVEFPSRYAGYFTERNGYMTVL